MKSAKEWLKVYCEAMQSDEPLRLEELIRLVQDDALQSAVGKALLSKWVDSITGYFEKKDKHDES